MLRYTRNKQMYTIYEAGIMADQCLSSNVLRVYTHQVTESDIEVVFTTRRAEY